MVIAALAVFTHVFTAEDKAVQFTRDPVRAVTVRQIERGRLQVGDTHYRDTVALTADSVLPDWPDLSLAALDLVQLEPLLALEPDVLIVGSGWTPALPPRELVFALARKNIGLEVMDTPAACRTFNILVAEDRRPGALLFLD